MLHKPSDHDRLIKRCISVDLEINPKNAKLLAFAAVRASSPDIVARKQSEMEAALDRLESATGGSDFLIGHNILAHDLPYLTARRPQLSRLAERAIDTLWIGPLAFPRNPYHHLVKHYQDGRLQADHANDPLLDAQLVFEVIRDQLDALGDRNREDPDSLIAYHYLATRMEGATGFDAFFWHLRSENAPDAKTAEGAVRRLLSNRACIHGVERLLRTLSGPRSAWPTAFALAWISVAGGDSVMPPWVRIKFREAPSIVQDLRCTLCDDPGCAWCRERDDPVLALRRWFGHESFRPWPEDDSGRSMQEMIVARAMRGSSLLGILPTGTGKSICYQVPALAKYEMTGALTVVISPLVALMADQVQGMQREGISSAVTVNGMLSMPERKDALERVCLGDVAILLISPEQLRSTSVRSALNQREVGYWVLDEAHCVSKWGHDFRPDYRYVGRFVKEFSGDEPPAPLLCLTATAKPDVVKDIRDHFASRLGIELELFDGGATRDNLTYEVRPSRRETKLSDILDAIEANLPAEGASGAVVYCATRSISERVAEFLKEKGLAAERYHAGLKPDEKTEIQEKFRDGNLRIVAATNAFGMGIDKPDIRLVVHGDIPSSLENYLQESGRAGRDREQANCILLFSDEDVERQFSLTARSRLRRPEIGAILNALRKLDVDRSNPGHVVATSGEIVREEREMEFERDSATDDTRVKTAISWLEEARLLSREENKVRIYPSSLQVRRLDEAEKLLAEKGVEDDRKRRLLEIVRHLMNAPRDQGITTDDLSGVGGFVGKNLRKALLDLQYHGIVRDAVEITIFVHVGIEDSSQQRLKDAASLETDLVATMREAAPDAEIDEPTPLHLPFICQALRDKGHTNARPDVVEKLLRSISGDGRDEDGGRGSIRIRKSSRNTLKVALQRSWSKLEKTAELRRLGAELLLNHLIAKTPKGAQGKDVQVETTMGAMLASLNEDALLSAEIADASRLMERSLLWMHEQGVITLGKGLTVFRPAMTVHLRPGRKKFAQNDFIPLEEHYLEQTIQIHVMAAYAKKGLDAIDQAIKLSGDYFALDRDDFLQRWLPGKETEIRRQTTGESYKLIVEELNNPAQRKIVADDRKNTNMLVLAGPGSGKTRVLVHRIAYLARIKRVDPRSILVLAYNRHAAAEIRARLRQLIGGDSNGITISTCHAFAMRLVGVSFERSSGEERDFSGIIQEAVKLLKGDGLPKSEAESQRDEMLQGIRWILVDEYQDIGPDEYELISAVAGRTLDDQDQKLGLFAVGDDDQNIYAFKGASVRYIRRFEEDYGAKRKFLTENYRSTKHIIDAANSAIAPAANRMKAGRDIEIDRKRRKNKPGGPMRKIDSSVTEGRVQILLYPPGKTPEEADINQAVAAVDEFQRLSQLDLDWNWSRAAIISRDWRRLEPVRTYAESCDIPVEMADEILPSIWRLREMQSFVNELRASPGNTLGISDLQELLNLQRGNRWTDLISQGVTGLGNEIGDGKMPVPEIVEWFAEWSRETQGEQRGLLLLTAHRAKGLEFDHVAILDGNWRSTSHGEDSDAPRRLFYVAMTRARLSLAAMAKGQHPFIDPSRESVLERQVAPSTDRLEAMSLRYVMPDMKLADLSWAGRLKTGNPSLNAISEARVGDPITMELERDYWMAFDAQGNAIARMSASYSPPDGKELLEGHVGAIVRRFKSDSEEEYLRRIRRDTWEVVLPKMIFG